MTQVHSIPRNETETVERVRRPVRRVFHEVQLFERATLKTLVQYRSLSREDYFGTVMPSWSLLKAGLLVDFKIEEMALFPTIIMKSKDARPLIFSLSMEQDYITEALRDFENIQDYEASQSKLDELITLLCKYIIKWVGITFSVTFSKEEETHIAKLASIIESWPAVIPY